MSPSSIDDAAPSPPEGGPIPTLEVDTTADTGIGGTNLVPLPQATQTVGLKLNPKWKRRGFARAASRDSVAQTESKLVTCGPLIGCYLDSAVHVVTNEQQDGLLERGCYGRPAGQGERDSSGPRGLTSTVNWLPDGILPWAQNKNDATQEDLAPGRRSLRPGRVYQLALEEAFFLTHSLRCLAIYSQEASQPDSAKPLDLSQLWTLFTRCNPRFPWHYAAYRHLRLKRWVVRAGLQYGAHFVVYRHHPELVHSDFAVLVMTGGHEDRVGSWSDLHAMVRLSTTVVKTLLLLYVSESEGAAPLFSPACLDKLEVEEVTVRRWLPEKHREASKTPNESASGQSGQRREEEKGRKKAERSGEEGEGGEVKVEEREPWMGFPSTVWKALSVRVWGEVLSEKEARRRERVRRWEAAGGQWRGQDGNVGGQVVEGS